MPGCVAAEGRIFSCSQSCDDETIDAFSALNPWLMTRVYLRNCLARDVNQSVNTVGCPGRYNYRRIGRVPGLFPAFANRLSAGQSFAQGNVRAAQGWSFAALGLGCDRARRRAGAFTWLTKNASLRAGLYAQHFLALRPVGIRWASKLCLVGQQAAERRLSPVGTPSSVLRWVLRPTWLSAGPTQSAADPTHPAHTHAPWVEVTQCDDRLDRVSGRSFCVGVASGHRPATKLGEDPICLTRS